MSPLKQARQATDYLMDGDLSHLGLSELQRGPTTSATIIFSSFPRPVILLSLLCLCVY